MTLKNHITIIYFLLFSIVTLRANTVTITSGEPIKKMTTVDLIENQEMNATINMTKTALTIDADEIMEYVLLYNADGELKFQLIADTKNLQVDKRLFEQGDYTMGIVLKEGQITKR